MANCVQSFIKCILCNYYFKIVLYLRIGYKKCELDASLSHNFPMIIAMNTLNILVYMYDID